MAELHLHHVSIVVADLDRSVEFYQRLFGLERVPRPPFKTPGAWLACGGLKLHLLHNPEGSFRDRGTVDSADGHFALSTGDFDGVLHALRESGYSEDVASDDPMRLVVVRDGVAGFPQLYLCDPDRNIIEVNGAAERY